MTKKTKTKLELAKLITVFGVDLNRWVPSVRNPKDPTRLEDMAKMKIAELRRELKKQKRVSKEFRDLNLINKLKWSIEKIVSLSKLYSAGWLSGGQLEEFRSYLGARND